MTKIKTIISLDISWNQLLPAQIRPLLEVMSKSRKIEHLNLSWNNLVDRTADEEDQEYVLLLLGKMIKYNQKILHLDLSGTGLTKNIVYGLGGCLRKSRSLLCIHLSGNPGLT